MEKELLKEKILARIKEHNESNPICSDVLEESYKVHGPSIRAAIRELRREYPIAGCSNGYYFADSFEQIKDTVSDLEGRATSMWNTANALRRIFKREQPTLFD
jgi:hypothetical protein